MSSQEYKAFSDLSRNERLELLTAWVDGKEIELNNTYFDGKWNTCSNPQWSPYVAYRVKPVALTKPSINWEHVHKDYKWMATDKSGETYVFTEIPTMNGLHGYWDSPQDSPFCGVGALASFVSGTCNWVDSLTERPE
jgi:hypothetical protein